MPRFFLKISGLLFQIKLVYKLWASCLKSMEKPAASCLISWAKLFYIMGRELSVGAKFLGKLSVSGRPTDFDNSRARALYACSRCEWELFGHCLFTI